MTFSSKAALFDPGKRVQRFVPDLAIEIVSQNDSFDTLWKKKERYRACGTAEVWIISPETREVFAYTQSGNRILSETDLLASPQIPGFSIAVGELLDRARL